MAKTADTERGGESIDTGDDVEIGRRMRAERKSQGISLREVAERIGGGVHLTTIAKLESGRMRVTYDWARKIAAALGTPALEFFVPEESANQAKAIPVYISINWGSDDLFSDAVNHYTASFTKRDDLIGIMFGPSQPDIESEWPLNTAIIDPEDQELKPGRTFVFFHRQASRHAMGVYRADPPRFVAWMNTYPDGAVLLSDDDVIVAGRVIEVQRTLVGRNG